MKDTEAYKLARANDPETSQISARVSMSGKRRELVYREVVNAGGKGITAKEIYEKYRNEIKGQSSISSRPNELEKQGLVFYAGDTREGSRVIRDVKWEASLTATAPKKPLERARIPKSDHYI